MKGKTCGAKTRAGGTCRKAPMANGRCRNHGGLSLSGIAHPSTKHGRYSKYLPTRLSGRFQEAQADPELTSVRDEIALVDVRIHDPLGRVDSGESGSRWEAIGSAVKSYRSGQDDVERAGSLDRIEGLATAGQDDYAAWREVLDLIERRRKLVETETKRLVTMGQSITAERAMILLAAVSDVIRRNVNDPGTLAKISRGIGELVSAP